MIKLNTEDPPEEDDREPFSEGEGKHKSIVEEIQGMAASNPLVALQNDPAFSKIDFSKIKTPVNQGGEATPAQVPITSWCVSKIIDLAGRHNYDTLEAFSGKTPIAIKVWEEGKMTRIRVQNGEKEYFQLEIDTETGEWEYGKG